MSQFNIIEGSKTMFRAAVLNDKQMTQVNAIAQHLGKSSPTNDEVRSASTALWGKKYAPYFIYRNLMIRSKSRPQTFDLSKLRSKSIAFVSPSEQLPAGEKSKSARKRGGKKLPPTMLPQLSEAECNALVLSNESALETLDAQLSEE
jgi:hypothetical protein